MTVLDPHKPIDEPIDGPALPFKYRTSWEIMMFFDIKEKTIKRSVGAICRHLEYKLERHRNGKQDALGDIRPGQTRLALTFHLSDLPAPREYTNPEAVYERIFQHLRAFAYCPDLFVGLQVVKRWRFLETVVFGIHEVAWDFDRIRWLQEEAESFYTSG